MSRMATNATKAFYCGAGLDNFHTSYHYWHGYISLIVCIMGTIANTLNIIVLTRREMRSPTNAVLTGLAVADLAVMLEYIPYTLHDYILFARLPREYQLTYAWACFVEFHSIFTQVLHTISIWLTVTLAVWRYIAVGYPHKNHMWCGMRTTLITIVSAYIVCIVVVAPSLYLITSIAEYMEMYNANGVLVGTITLTQYLIDFHQLPQGHVAWNSKYIAGPPIEMLTSTLLSNGSANSSVLPTANSVAVAVPLSEVAVHNITVYRVVLSDLALRNGSLYSVTFLIYSVLIKLIPCIALTILSARLISALLEAKRRRKMLTGQTANGLKPINNGGGGGGNSKPAERPRKNSKTIEKEKQTDRTTRMLLAVLLLFLITEFPQGIIGLLSTILGQKFFEECYLKLSDVMDIMALINSSINFILYCSMSRQFRSTFTLLFRPKFFDKWLPVAQDDTANGGRAGGGGRRGRAGGADGEGCSLANGRKRNGEMISRSYGGDQQFQTTTQVTNV